jgi:uncharacterized membrane protein
MSGAEVLIGVHILAWAAYFGSQFAVIYMLLPAAEKAPDEAHRREALIAGFKFYNPFSLGALLVIVITGAMRLTDLKAEMKFDYFAKIGGPLAIKLALAFLIIFLQVYVSLGLAFRIGRQEEIAAHGDGAPFTVEQVNSILARIRAMVWVTIVLTAAAVMVSLTMVRRASADAVVAFPPARAALMVVTRVRPAARAKRVPSDQARLSSELNRYSTVTSPKAIPGSSVSRLFWAKRIWSVGAAERAARS